MSHDVEIQDFSLQISWIFFFFSNLFNDSTPYLYLFYVFIQHSTYDVTLKTLLNLQLSCSLSYDDLFGILKMQSHCSHTYEIMSLCKLSYYHMWQAYLHI